MRCPECGSPVHPGWDICRGCQAELRRPRARTAAIPSIDVSGSAALARKRIVEGARTLRLPTIDRLRGVSSAVSAGGRRAAVLAGAGVARLRALRGGHVPPVVGTVAIGVALVLALLLGEQHVEVVRAHAAADAAGARLTALQQATASAEQARTRLQTAEQQAQASASSVAGQRDDLQQRLDAASKQVSDLQAKITDLSAAADKAQQQADSQGQTLSLQQQELHVLTECLSGTQVAVEFGRSGRWTSADKALEAVNDSCTAARALL